VAFGQRRDERQVGDADDLTVPGQATEAFPHRLCDGTTDPGIYFVEHQKVNAVTGLQRRLERQHHPRQLASGGDSR